MKQILSLPNGLTARVVFFLTLALLPLGIIGVVQNQQLLEQVQTRSELSLLAMTEQAVSGEKEVILETFGAAQAIGGLIDFRNMDVDLCRDAVNAYLAKNPTFAFVGFTDVTGISACSTANRTLDFSSFPNFAASVESPRPMMTVNLDAPGSRQSVLIVTEPLFEGDTLIGFVSISLPVGDVGNKDDFLGNAEPELLITFNSVGDLLSSEQTREDANENLPKDILLSELVRESAETFVSENQLGEELIYTVVPITPGVVYALAAWNRSKIVAQAAPQYLNIGLPILMWLASLTVVWFVVDRFVIAGVRSLHAMMQRFADNRKLPTVRPPVTAPVELRQLHEGFSVLAESVLRDEAELENRVHEKSVLLKEVHHRVKNNLQIVSSIMNMQIRKAHMAETKQALRQVQDRIMGLSGVHRTLYQVENLNEVDAGRLIKQIVDQTQAMGNSTQKPTQITTDLARIRLFPDQAVPLSMLVAECLTNAVKYGGGRDPRVHITLEISEPGIARLEIENTKPQKERARDENSSGLGQQLIRAFGLQLNATTDIQETDETYRVIASFKIEEFRQEPLEY